MNNVKENNMNFYFDKSFDSFDELKYKLANLINDYTPYNKVVGFEKDFKIPKDLINDTTNIEVIFGVKNEQII